MSIGIVPLFFTLEHVKVSQSTVQLKLHITNCKPGGLFLLPRIQETKLLHAWMPGYVTTDLKEN
jgi:hypothetical protein